MYTTGTNPNYQYSTKMGEDLVNDFEEVMAGKMQSVANLVLYSLY